VFSNLNWWEIAVLALIGLFIFGPERLPKVISDAVRTIRSVRDMARNATNDLSRELGTEVKLEDLHPKTFIRKHLLSEEDEAALRRPFDDAYQQVKGLADDVNDTASGWRPADPPVPRSGMVTGQPTPEQPPSPTMGQPPAQPSAPTGYPAQGYADPGQPYTGTGYSGTGHSDTGHSGTGYSGTGYGSQGYDGQAYSQDATSQNQNYSNGAAWGEAGYVGTSPYGQPTSGESRPYNQPRHAADPYDNDAT
jgi:sec-independent protein translocase protein TatB